MPPDWFTGLTGELGAVLVLAFCAAGIFTAGVYVGYRISEVDDGASEVPCPEGHLSSGGASICEVCNGTGKKYSL